MRSIPFTFVLETLAPLKPFTRPMFGCEAVYVDDKIVLILRDKPSYPQDNGVWVATTVEHHDSLKAEFPTLRSIELFGGQVTGWQVLPQDSLSFESDVDRVCALIARGDGRIGKVPQRRNRKSKKSAKASKKRKATRGTRKGAKAYPRKKAARAKK